MARISYDPPEMVDPELQASLRRTTQKMGHVPINGLLFARVPGLAEAMVGLSHAVLVSRRVEISLKWLVGHVSSRVAGCRYCWAHTAHNAVHQNGVDPAKFEHVWEFEQSELFSDRERVALRLALAAGVTPSAVTDAHFDELHQHFDDDEILELVAVIAMFGFMNRWNDTLAVPLEEPPLQFALQHLSESGWTPGPHT